MVSGFSRTVTGPPEGGHYVMKIALVRADNADEASQSVQRLEHRRDERGVAAVARENLTDRGFNPADQFFGFLPFLIGHVRVPSASGWRRSSPHRAANHSREDIRFSASGHRRQAEPRSEHALAWSQGVRIAIATDTAASAIIATSTTKRRLRQARRCPILAIGQHDGPTRTYH